MLWTLVQSYTVNDFILIVLVQFHTAIDLIFYVWSGDFTLYLQPLQIERHHTSDFVNDLIPFVGHFDLYQGSMYFSLISLALSNR